MTIPLGFQSFILSANVRPFDCCAEILATFFYYGFLSCNQARDNALREGLMHELVFFSIKLLIEKEIKMVPFKSVT